MNDGHKVEGCTGKWIDVGTLRDPYRQLCAVCRASRQKPADDGEILDVEALSRAERRHMNGLARLKADLEADESAADPVHQDESGFWFWDETWTVRYGPWATEAECRQQMDAYIDAMGLGYHPPAEKPGIIDPEELRQASPWLLVFWIGAFVVGALLAWGAFRVLASGWRALF